MDDYPHAGLDDMEDALNFFRGLVWGVAVCSVFWLAVGTGLWWALG